MLNMKLTAYLAGPDVFLPDALEVGRRKVALCAEAGIHAHFPMDNKPAPGKTGRALAMEISALNEDLVAACHIVIANMTPFRSPSLDPGTAFEIGYARALHKPIFGYSSAAGTLTERTRIFEHLAPGATEDANGYKIENFGLVDNLMMDGGIEASGGSIVVVPEDSLAAFAAFEMLVSRIAAAS
jgi:nucleoside 2-deoxyribosyltransferase